MWATFGGYTMLTYPKDTSTAPGADACFRRPFVREGSAQYPEKAQEAKGDFLDFIVREVPAEFVSINYPELLNRLAAELLWCCHAPSLRGRRGEKRTADLLNATWLGALAIPSQRCPIRLRPLRQF